MAMTSSSIAQDVSSLRAAALLTLKSKAKPRNHPPSQAPFQDDTSSVAPIQRAPPSPVLNYGSDDGMPVDGNESTEGDDGDDGTEGEKEEGEISDDDTGAAAKAPPMLMDIDDQPLPGLNASSINVTDSEDADALTHDGQKSPTTSLAPATSKAPTDTHSNSALSGPAKSSAVVLDDLSTQPVTTSTAAKPIPSTTPSLETGSRPSKPLPVNKQSTPPLTPSVTSKTSVPSTSGPISRIVPPRPPPLHGTDRQETDLIVDTERTKTNRHTPPPVFSRQLNSKPSLLLLDDAHVRPSLSSELSHVFLVTTS